MVSFLLIASCGEFEFFVFEFFLMAGGGLVVALVLPDGDVGEVLVVASGFAVVGLVFGAEVAAAGFFADEGVVAHDFAEFEEVGDAACAFEFGVEVVVLADDADALPEFFAELADFVDGLGEAVLGAGHAAFFPHDVAEFLVEGAG